MNLLCSSDFLWSFCEDLITAGSLPPSAPCTTHLLHSFSAPSAASFHQSILNLTLSFPLLSASKRAALQASPCQVFFYCFHPFPGDFHPSHLTSYVSAVCWRTVCRGKVNPRRKVITACIWGRHRHNSLRIIADSLLWMTWLWAQSVATSSDHGIKSLRSVFKCILRYFNFIRW